ncbi:TPA: nucleoside triphosphate pyrophosphohydrolase family protein [Pseudomonas aeruginosa]|uniref:nucleoside triphosphate pyrophosphohydrolase family protein n=1 Tax=Pseudomonas aeruginosa TaxID=287 RepID=UPI00053E7818|nr:nucleoside triphosphate pyrophosphohydrolase family protein [Pseudomonas aeruginosa]HCL3990060.1 nucleoside triphosphate pyrophosphohydrolase family protein [Pseudomonas aeruginosa]
MDIDYYQTEAQKTDRIPGDALSHDEARLIVPLLGLAGEVGELLSEYKKHIRDGDAHILFKERVAEEVGDLLWYIANVASKFELKLSDVAKGNLQKTSDRWNEQASIFNLDAGYLDNERFPRRFEVELREEVVGDDRVKIFTYINGEQVGDPLTDNSYDPDGYRFHDVFHLSYVAILGWSPVIRKLLGRKRRSVPLIDEVEDGGRAQVIDEGVAALVFDYAKQHSWLENVTEIDFHLLKTIKGVTSLYEVRDRSMREWQRAILTGFKVWREVVKNNGGHISIDLDLKSMVYNGK